MAAILSTRFPQKASELFAYLATIVQAEHNYEGKRWVLYDRQYHREALACKVLDWSQADPCLYNEAFTGRARSIARCSYCLQDDHLANACPRNPNKPVLGWLTEALAWPSQPQVFPKTTPAQLRPSEEICRKFNDGRCRYQRCRYCINCQGPHPRLECPQNRARFSASNMRSPLRPGPQAAMPPPPR